MRLVAIGTELPFPNACSSVANGGKADKKCSMRVLRILTHGGRRPDRNPAVQQTLRRACYPKGMTREWDNGNDKRKWRSQRSTL